MYTIQEIHKHVNRADTLAFNQSEQAISAITLKLAQLHLNIAQIMILQNTSEAAKRATDAAVKAYEE